jgi:hypothetical protein
MIINKADTLKTLKVIAGFDNTASPYVAVQLHPEKTKPLFYRSGNYGFIHSVGLDDTKLVYVSINHLLDCLRNLNEEQVSMTVESNGGLRVASIDAVFGSDLRVHTVSKEQAGLKYHDVGSITQRLSSGVFSGVDVHSFTLSAPPVLMRGKLMLGTIHGIVGWSGAEEVLSALTVFPRESFLRAAGGDVIIEVVLTEQNYWGVSFDDLVLFTSGHNTNRTLYETYDVPGTELARLPSERLLTCLKSASNLCGDAQKVVIDPKLGVVTADRFGNQAIFSLGGIGGWPKFSVFAKTSKLIVDALGQSTDEEAVLYDMPTQVNPTMRLRRGKFEVNFRTIS